MRVVVLGAGGQVGKVVASALLAHPDFELVAGVDPKGAEGAGYPVVKSLAELGEHFDVAVDFTRRDAVIESAEECARRGAHMVIGTTGLKEADLTRLKELFKGPPNAIVAPNFAIGAVLMMQFARQAAKYLGAVEIIELHHDRKLDAPSGTALATARLIAEALSSPVEAPETSRDPARGYVGPGGIAIHSVRLKGLVAHQEVIFGESGQSLVIRHDVYDREAFVPGVVAALKSVDRLPGLTVGLEKVLGFE